MGKDRLAFPEPFTALGRAPDSRELEELNAVIVRACAPDPRDRYASAEEMHVDIALLKSGRSVKAKHLLERRLVFARRAGAVVGLAAALAAMAYAYQQGQTREARNLARAESAQRARAEGYLDTLQAREAEHWFEAGEANLGIAYLARLLRANPSNHVAAARLRSALTEASFALPRRVFTHAEPADWALPTPDGSRILAGSAKPTNGMAWLWDSATRKVVAEMPVPAGITHARISPDGHRIATGARNGTVQVWDTATGLPSGPPWPAEPDPDPANPPGPVADLGFSPDGTRLAIVSGRRVRVLDVRTGGTAFPALTAEQAVLSARFSPDGTLFATLGGPGFILTVWESGTGRFRSRLTRPDPPCQSPGEIMQFTRDGRQIAAMSDKSLILSDPSTGRVDLEIPHEALMTTFAISPDDDRIATGDQQASVHIWDRRTGRPLTLPLRHRSEVHHVEFDPTGERLLTQEGAGRSRVWDARTGEPLTEWLGNSAAPRFSHDGSEVLARTTDSRRVALWDVRPGRASNIRVSHPGIPVTAARFNSDGSRVLTVTGGYASLFEGGGTWDATEAALWDPATGAASALRIPLPGGVQHGEFSPDGRRFVTAGCQGHVQLWESDTGIRTLEPWMHDGRVWMALFSPDGSRVATACDDHKVRLWSTTSGKRIGDDLDHRGPCRGIRFSPNGRFLLSTGGTHAWLWDLATAAPHPLTSGLDVVFDAVFSPDGTQIAVAYGGTEGFQGAGKALVWDTGSGRPILGPFRHQKAVLKVRFSPDGHRIATASGDGTCRIWEARSAEAVGEPMVHPSPVDWLEFGPDNRVLLTGTINHRSTRLWDVGTGRPITGWLPHPSPVSCVGFSPDGSRHVTGATDGSARVWEVPVSAVPVPAWMLDLAEAMAGLRLLEGLIPEQLSPDSFLAAQGRLPAPLGSDPDPPLARWLLADRIERPASPHAAGSALQQLQEGIAWDSTPTLREALRFLPGHAAATARLARRLPAASDGNAPERRSTTNHLIERALRLDPREPQAWITRAIALRMDGELPDALRALDEASASDPTLSEPGELAGDWLAAAGRDAEALDAYSRAIAPGQRRIDATRDAERPSRELRRLRLKRSSTLTRLGRHPEASEERRLALGIPPRDLGSPATLLDLSSHYDRALTESQSLWASRHPGDNLASLPRGDQILGGIRYDLRGSLLVGASPVPREQAQAPNSVRGIPVNLRCRQLHFLHALARPSPAHGTLVGRYVIHFEDGSHTESPVLAGQTIGGWIPGNTHGSTPQPPEVAWQEANEDVHLQGGPASHLYHHAWPNPRPETRITRIDLEAVSRLDEGQSAFLLLVAITAQAEASPEILRHPASRTAIAGATTRFEVAASGEPPLVFQWMFNGVPLPGATNAFLDLPQVQPEHAGTYTAEVRNAARDSVVRATSAPAHLVVLHDGLAHGILRSEVYRNIPGADIASLTNHPGFPARPDGTHTIHAFETPSNSGEDYGIRVSGFLLPPRTGDYRFLLASDDEGMLFLGDPDQPRSLRRIAHEPSNNAARLWSARSRRDRDDNISAPIHLEAGRRYYVEAWMKEGGGHDNLGIAWQPPGMPLPRDLTPPIQGTFLAIPAAWMRPVDAPLLSTATKAPSPAPPTTSAR